MTEGGVDAGVAGTSLALAATGLLLLPLEPISGLALLATGVGGVGLGAAGRKQRRLEAELSTAQQTAAERGMEQGVLVKLEGRLREAEAARAVEVERADALAASNTQLKYWLLGGAAVGLMTYLYRQRQQQQQRRTSPRRKTTPLRIGDATVAADTLPAGYAPKRAAPEGDSYCAVCIEHVPDALLRPCMHLQLCWECLQRLPAAACPVCRAPFDAVEYVYLG